MWRSGEIEASRVNAKKNTIGIVSGEKPLQSEHIEDATPVMRPSSDD